MEKTIAVTLKIDNFKNNKYFSVSDIEYSSGLSTLYKIKINAQYYKREVIKQEDIVGSKVSIRLKSEFQEAALSGIITSFDNIVDYSVNKVKYSKNVVFLIEPPLALLKYRKNFKVFPKGKVTDIIQTVLGTYNIDVKLPSDQEFADREFAVQYNETDFNFINRMMEEEGIFYYHEFSDGSVTLVLGSSTSDYKQDLAVEFSTGSNYYQYHSLTLSDNLQIEKASLNDYDPTAPKKNLFSENNKNKSRLNCITDAVDYLYPYNVGSYLKSDSKTKDTGRKYANQYLEAIQTNNESISFAPSYVIWWGIDAGSKIKIDCDDNEYVIRNFMFKICIDDNLQNSSSIAAFNSENVFRPLRITVLPDVPVQTATVIGTDSSSDFFIKTEDSADMNIYLKVKFHWDTVNKENSESCSCWIRAGQPWGGNGRGFVFVPRVGDEVVIAFEYGHPDKPVIIGSVYNGQNTLPYSLKKNQATSAIVGKSTPKGSSASSAMVFVDDKDKEQLALLTMGSFYTRIKKERFVQLGDSTLEYVKKDVNVTVDGNYLHKVKGEVSMDIGKDINIKSGGKVNIEAKEISLKVGGNFVKIDSSGVVVNGSQTKINSGGSGNAASVTEPQKIPDDLSKVDAYKMVPE